MVRGKTTTLCRSRDEPGGVKAQRRTASMPSLVLGSALAFSQAFAAVTQFAGRSKAQAHCLRSGGLAPRSLSRVHDPGYALPRVFSRQIPVCQSILFIVARYPSLRHLLSGLRYCLEPLISS